MKSKNEFAFGFDKLHSILEKCIEVRKSESKHRFPNRKHPSVGRSQMVFNVSNRVHKLKVNFPIRKFIMEILDVVGIN